MSLTICSPNPELYIPSFSPPFWCPDIITLVSSAEYNSLPLPPLLSVEEYRYYYFTYIHRAPSHSRTNISLQFVFNSLAHFLTQTLTHIFPRYRRHAEYLRSLRPTSINARWRQHTGVLVQCIHEALVLGKRSLSVDKPVELVLLEEQIREAWRGVEGFIPSAVVVGMELEGLERERWRSVGEAVRGLIRGEVGMWEKELERLVRLVEEMMVDARRTPEGRPEGPVPED